MNNNRRDGGLAPGSAEAASKGCTCPRETNRHGQGMYRHEGIDYFLMADNCPLHGVVATNTMNIAREIQ